MSGSKSGDVTVTALRRWAHSDRYLIPAETWQRDRLQHYAVLGLPVAADEFIERLGGHLALVTTAVDARMPGNQALTIDRGGRGEFTLARLAGRQESETVEESKQLIESRLNGTDLVDILIELDNETDFLRHFASQGTYKQAPFARAAPTQCAGRTDRRRLQHRPAADGRRLTGAELLRHQPGRRLELR